MIGLILGTAEGKNIVSLLNKFTDNILISTATEYGGDLLKKYNYKVLNTKPLNIDELKELLRENRVTVLLDASHPYATEISINCKKVCCELKIIYLRYQRASVADKYRNNPNVIFIPEYKDLVEHINTIEQLKTGMGVILNTTGSRHIEELMSLGIINRIVHRILPSSSVMKHCMEIGVKVEDIIAIKGPVGYELNKGFIKQYKATAMILKDSGIQGGTEEKIQAALSEGVVIFIIERKKEQYEYGDIFTDEVSIVKYIKENILF